MRLIKALSAALIVALALASAGCKKTPGYVGSFRMQLTASQRSDLDKMKAQLAKVPEQDRKEAEAQLAAVESMTLIIEADGTWKTLGAPGGQDVTGTYKADGNTLTLTPAASTKNGTTPGKAEYNDADQTLTTHEAQAGQELKFKKV